MPKRTIKKGRGVNLLRYADTQAKSLGFARAGSFYPDFLLWLVDDATGQQWLSFADPKGIRNLDLNDPKLGLYAEIKERQKELDDPDLILNAFILSYTAHGDLLNIGTAGSKTELEDRHVLFMDDGRDAYLSKLFERIAAYSRANASLLSTPSKTWFRLGKNSEINCIFGISSP